MFQGRLGFVRMTAVAAVSACCLGTVACGGSGSASDPLTGLTGKKVATEVIANTTSASSLKLAGALSESGHSFTVNLGIKPGKGCTGTVGMSGKGSFSLIMIGKTFYMKPDDKFWKTLAGSQANLAIRLFKGKYLKGSTSSSSVSGMNDLCDVPKMFKSVVTSSSSVTKGKVTTLGGTRVLPLKAADGSTAYVTDTSKPELVQVVAPKGTKGGSGKLTITVGAPVTLTAPPASQVVDASKLGM